MFHFPSCLKEGFTVSWIGQGSRGESGLSFSQQVYLLFSRLPTLPLLVQPLSPFMLQHPLWLPSAWESWQDGPFSILTLPCASRGTKWRSLNRSPALACTGHGVVINIIWMCGWMNFPCLSPLQAGGPLRVGLQADLSTSAGDWSCADRWWGREGGEERSGDGMGGWEGHEIVNTRMSLVWVVYVISKQHNFRRKETHILMMALRIISANPLPLGSILPSRVHPVESFCKTLNVSHKVLVQFTLLPAIHRVSVLPPSCQGWIKPDLVTFAKFVGMEWYFAA